MRIQYTEKAAKQLKKISKDNLQNAKLIVSKIEKYIDNPNESSNIKHLKGRYGDFLRLRVGDFRIIFDIELQSMNIIEIKNRKDAYYD